MATNRRANSVIFGFDFQVNSAIVLFLENIVDAKTLKLEGNCEDIEIELNTGEMILAQAKAVVQASSDFTNVKRNMKKALETLSEAQEKVKVKELIFITNSPNPFDDDESRSVFYGHAHRGYATLPPSSKRIIDTYVSELGKPLEKDKLKIQVLPFETDDDNERYKVIMQCVNDFIGTLKLTIPGIGKQLLETWHWKVFDNGGKKDANIVLTKNDMIWPLLVKITDITQYEDQKADLFDSGVYEEVTNRYRDIINSHCEQCEFFIKVLSDYNSFKSSKKSKDRELEFVDTYLEEYLSEFKIDDIEPEIQEAMAKIVILNIIKRRFVIDRIKEEVNL